MDTAIIMAANKQTIKKAKVIFHLFARRKVLCGMFWVCSICAVL
jgi:hypothetical protein